MRWTALFNDLEAQAESLSRSELDAELRDRTRREVALLRLGDRLALAAGRSVQLRVLGAGAVQGTLLDAGPDWLLLDEGGGREALVPTQALLSVTGLGPGSRAPASAGELAKRLDLRWALRGLARDRASLAVALGDGTALTGRLDRVAADYVELAEHRPGEALRTAAPGPRLIPLPGLALLRRL